MAASSSLPQQLAVLIFLLLVVASAGVPATAGGGKQYSGAKMVIIRGPATTRVGGGGDAGAQSDKWRQHYRRVEDEAPELGGSMLLGAGDGGSLGNRILVPDNTGCKSSSQCAAKGHGSYTRPCTFKDQCSHRPPGLPGGIATKPTFTY